MQHEEPYLPLTCIESVWKNRVHMSYNTGAAWLSSARVVRCLVKSYNERNPLFLLLFILLKIKALLKYCQREVGGRWGRRQVLMALMGRASHVIQWLIQLEANLLKWANL